MSMNIELTSVGRVKALENGFSIQVDQEYIEALRGLEGYSHLQIVLWADRCDTPQMRKTRTIDNLFKKGPDNIGVFATRAPARPNPLLIKHNSGSANRLHCWRYHFAFF